MIAFCVIVLSSLFLACPEPSRGQNDTGTSPSNNYTSQTSLINSTERLSVHNQWPQKQGQTSTPTGYHILSDQGNDKDYNKKTPTQHNYQLQNYNQNFRLQSQNTSDEVNNHSITWNNKSWIEHTSLNQNYSNELILTSERETTSNSHVDQLGISNITHNSSNHMVPYGHPLVDGDPVTTDNWGFGPFSNLKSVDKNVGDNNRLTSLKPPLLQWHVGIYSKTHTPFMQICGGTLVTTSAIISAAHCFWNDFEGVLPTWRFVVAAGKLYRPWNDPHDIYAQKSEISEIHLPTRFRGAFASFQDDIAVVLLVTAFVHSPALRPLCVLFDEDLEDAQLQKGNEGVVLGWGLTAENGPPAQALQYLNMPYVPTKECIAGSEPSFVKYITSDKICAGVTTGKALCQGDSGGGLVFFAESPYGRVPLLLGVASTAPRNEHPCNTHALGTLTRVLAHRVFLRKHVPDIEKACRKNYAIFDWEAHQPDYSDLNRSAAPQNNQVQAMEPGKTKFICNCYCNNATKH